jgi:DivIVA domain-containing protein
MSSSRLPLSSRPAFLPDEVSRREFATVFRGYDPAEVRSFLNQLAEQAADSSDRIAEMQRALAETESRANNPELDEETVTKLLGEQTAQILRSAREAAGEMRSKAEADVSRQLRESHEVTTRMREEAEALLNERTDEAEKAAEVIRSAAKDEADRIRNETESEMMQLRQQTQSDLVDERSRARQQMRDLVDTARAEAQSLVDRTQEKQGELLDGLVRKRKIAMAQVEELRAGRARLLEAYKLVRTTLDEVTVELGKAEQDASDKAADAGRQSIENSGLAQSDMNEVVDIEQFSLGDDVSDEVIRLMSEDAPEGSTGAGTGAGSSPMSSSGSGQLALAEQVDIEVIEDDDEFTADAAELENAAAIDEALATKRDAVVTKAQAQILRRIRRTMQDEQEGILSDLGSVQVETVDQIIGSVDDQIASYQRSVVRLFREVVRTGASAVEGGAPVDRSITDHTGTAAARQFIAEMVEDLRSQLEPAVEAALEAGDAEQSATLISEAYEAINGDQLEDLTSDRIAGAFDQGTDFAQV